MPQFRREAWPPEPACRAPFTSLHLDPRGEVRACCQNPWHRLGNVRDTELVDIWRGGQLQRLRDAVGSGSFHLGCELCQECVASGTPETAYLHGFVDLDPLDDSCSWPVQLELALSNACNLRCVQCNGELSSSIRALREHRAPMPTVYDARTLAQLEPFLSQVQRVILLGGEPFLSRESLWVMERLIGLDTRPRCHVSTNGTQWNRRVEAILEHLPVHVSISVDGRSRELVESIRVGVDHGRLIENIARIGAAATRAGGTYALSFCMMRQNWREFGAVIDWADELEVDLIVNAVQHPPAFSLLHAPDEELQRAATTLLREDAATDRGGGRNGGVWRAQLQAVEVALRARGTNREDQHATSVVLAPTRRNPTTSVLTANPAQVVVSVRSDDVVLAPLLDRLVGASLQEFVIAATSAFGELHSSELRRHEGGGELRRLHFGSDGSGTTLLATLRTDEHGAQTWTVERRDR